MDPVRPGVCAQSGRAPAPGHGPASATAALLQCQCSTIPHGVSATGDAGSYAYTKMADKLGLGTNCVFGVHDRETLKDEHAEANIH